MMVHRAMWLYGSHARGDARPDSDLDVLLIGDGELPERALTEFGDEWSNPSVSRYSWREIRGMAKYGSLFLHHLRLEGRPVFEDEECRGVFRRLLDGLPRYTMASRDVRGFAMVLKDIEKSGPEGWSDPFELSVLATIIRHSAILGCWLHGCPEFGRTSPVRAIVDAIGCPGDWNGFGELYNYRLYGDGRIGSEMLISVDGKAWWGRARELVDHLEVIAGGDYREVS